WRLNDPISYIDVLQPKSPLFNWPNQINGSDWDNWIQERGLYFPMEWDDRFDTFISMSDKSDLSFNGPFESGILMAHYGKGSYLYTNLGWYRQIQNIVPGGYRIFTNLLAYPLRDANVGNIITLVERYQEDGEFTGEETVHKLKLHLKAVKHFEQQEKDEKVVKHMEGFKTLLEHQHNSEFITDKAYTHLKEESNKLIQK